MPYQKKSGWILSKIVTVTPMWIDCLNVKTGVKMTFFFRRMIDKKAEHFYAQLASQGRPIGIKCKKMGDEPGHYFFLNSSLNMMMFMQSRIAKKIKKEQEHRAKCIEEGWNPARAKHSKSLTEMAMSSGDMMYAERLDGKLALAKALEKEVKIIKAPKVKERTKEERHALMSASAKEAWKLRKKNQRAMRLEQLKELRELANLTGRVSPYRSQPVYDDELDSL